MNIPLHLRAKVPVLKPAEIAAAQYGFIQAIEREFIIMGLKSDATMKRLLAIRPELLVAPKTSGVHEVRYRNRAGLRLALREAIADIADEIQTEARLAVFGPDPVGLLVERLVALDIPRAEAENIAQHRIQRLDDGRVAAIDMSRKQIVFAPPTQPGESLTPEEQSRRYDANEAVTRATRIILEQRAAAPARVAEVRVDPGIMLGDNRGGVRAPDFVQRNAVSSAF